LKELDGTGADILVKLTPKLIFSLLRGETADHVMELVEWLNWVNCSREGLRVCLKSKKTNHDVVSNLVVQKALCLCELTVLS
jgi:hypothetical protein